MNITEFIRTNELSFARRRVAQNPRLADMGGRASRGVHFRVGIRCQDRRAVFYFTADTSGVSDEEFLRWLAVEAREACIPEGEFNYATGGRFPTRSRLARRATGFRALLGPTAFETLTTTVVL